jgi:hypothetical protein
MTGEERETAVVFHHGFVSGTNRNSAPTSVPGIPTAFSRRVLSGKTISCAAETGKSIRSPVGIGKLYVDESGLCFQDGPPSPEFKVRACPKGGCREMEIFYSSFCSVMEGFISFRSTDPDHL